MKRLQKLIKNTSEAHCQAGHFTLKFHFLDHVIEAMENVGSVNVFLCFHSKNIMSSYEECRSKESQNQQNRSKKSAKLLERVKSMEN